ncbi:ATP-binding sensor histidine kinase [Nannocystis sp. SCPEA4]|uniref:ATP-binding sensor histidine kinase n=1 Tax=Nannocystis sp. SCPEA4 TaxID=2996787 RepID=UPI00226DF69B|nr:ATP-binding sensor histidine kinase [Nannocystis sp. SCPEA4]MCY1058969.1 trifunctional serine/threonine-protein kinase/ATP-binding protein/sensor histidine kinase [Nannocystis sp. SCPEA4]
MDASPRFSLKQRLHEGQNSIIFRGVREDEQTPVVIKVLKGEYPSPRALRQLRREFVTLRELDVPGVVRVYSLENYGNGLALVMEDDGGVPLSDVIRGEALQLHRALELGVALADTLARLHERAIIHKDIKPHNILVNSSTGSVKLIDFGIATTLAHEAPQVSSPEALEGTLMYMSPEQSGRVNRVVDQRTDLYSLGVTLYEMLTGSVPFTANDAMELVHSHIARTPVPPWVRTPTIPRVVSDIVMKLLAKGPEDRYQHAHGLSADLARCLAELDETGDVAAFELGQHDRADVLRIPQKLYGREADIRALTEAFARVQDGRAELLLVAGGAGVGKSMLAHEVHRVIARSGGRFVTGKFDLVQRNVPFSALASALSELIRQLLTESSRTLAEWRTRIQLAVGQSGQLVVDLVPELERVIGRQPPLPPLRPTESQNRFGLVMQNFVRALCPRTSPLVIFLDDLQWADAGTLSLLRLILTDPDGGHLLLVGAYRDAEVDLGHPLRAAVTQLRKDGVALSELSLGPLDRASVRALLADTLTRERPGVAPPRDEVERLDGLASLVFDKTHGNPFFLTQFLMMLHRGGLIRFDAAAGAWSWDTAAVAAAPITENVAELMSERLREFPADTQQLLAIAACVGHEFDVVTLARISERSLARVAAELWPALHAGLVVPLDSNYRLLAATDDGPPEANETVELVVACRFLHDRVQQAALSLTTPEALHEVHLRIGRSLQAAHVGELRGDALFEVVRHLNAGAPRLTDPCERLQLARANLEAARAAKRATAYAAGTAFAAAGIAVLPDGSWDSEYALTLGLQREQAECDYMCGRVDRADAKLEELIGRAHSPVEQADLFALRIMLLCSQGRFAEGLVASRTGLAQFGERLPEGAEETMATFGAVYGEIEANLAGRTVESLADAPAMRDPAHSGVLRLLNEAFGAGFVVDARLGSVVILKHVLLSLTHGPGELSAFGFATYGFLLVGPLGRPADALRYGRLALQLLERFTSTEVASRVHFMVGFYTGHTRPLRDSLHHLHQARVLGLEHGDFMYASQGAVFHALANLRRGEDLSAVREEIDQGLALMVRTRDAMSTAQLVLLGNVVDALQHERWFGGPLFGDNEGEANWLRGVDAAGLVIVRCLHHITKLMVATLFEAYPEALALIAAAQPLMFISVGGPQTADLPFYAALALAASHGLAEDETERASLMERLLEHRAVTATWAQLCPENEQHRLHIIDAEIARLRGQDLVALDEYDRAIEWARRSQFIHHEAIANELCGRFHQHRGRSQIARVYLGQARYGYERWGALAKVRALDVKYPHLAARAETVGSTITASSNRALITSSLSTTGNQGLDLTSVIKAAQALTAEIAVEPLLEKIIQIMIENAGARRGVLLLERDGQLCVVAESSVDTGSYTLKVPLPLPEAASVPVSIVNYVVHTSDSVVLEDAARAGPFTTDAYVARSGMRSILCTPLVHQTKLTGVLYLENELIPSVFPEARLHTLKLIASQAAISIENANLYANMERLVQKRTDELHRVNQSLTASNAELDAFARTVAHDLKNPLGAMVGYSEYLLEHIREVDTDEVERVVENIRRASHTATNIIDELLLLAGVRKQQVQSSRLDMGAIILQVQQRMAYMLTEYAGELSAPATWPAALGYAPWIEEAWTNYISNGLKYGGSPPRLELGADELDDGKVRFWLRDNGPGIEPEAQARLFAEFSRLDNVRAEGHGLGLSIVRRIIERLGGTVGVESELGRGSLFFFTLPTG